MAEVIRTEEGAEFHGLSGARSLGDVLILSGPYNVADAPNAYLFARPNTINIDGKDWTAVLSKIGVPVSATNSALLRAYIEDAWKLAGTTPDDAAIDANSFDLSDTWPAGTVAKTA